MAATAPQTEASRLAARYSDWAGSQSNAEALVTGLRSGSPVTLVTNGADRSVSLAGFSPSGPMSYGAVGNALSGAAPPRGHLASEHRADPGRPDRGDVLASNSKLVAMRGSVAARSSGPSPAAKFDVLD
jgi:hypothetical protein